MKNGGEGSEDKQAAHLEILRNLGKKRHDRGRLGGREQRWTRGLILGVFR